MIIAMDNEWVRQEPNTQLYSQLQTIYAQLVGYHNAKYRRINDVSFHKIPGALFNHDMSCRSKIMLLKSRSVCTFWYGLYIVPWCCRSPSTSPLLLLPFILCSLLLLSNESDESETFEYNISRAATQRCADSPKPSKYLRHSRACVHERDDEYSEIPTSMTGRSRAARRTVAAV